MLSVELTKLEACDSEMPFSYTGMNHHAIFDHRFPFLQIPNSFDLDNLSGTEIITQKGSMQHEELIGDEIAEVSQHIDHDLSAVVEKCNVKGLSMARPALQIFREVPCDNNAHGDHYKIDAANKTTPQLHCATEPVVQKAYPQGLEDNRHKSLNKKRSNSGDSRVLSERLRRSEMNHLFAQIHSLLPSQTAKDDEGDEVEKVSKHLDDLSAIVEKCNVMTTPQFHCSKKQGGEFLKKKRSSHGDSHVLTERLRRSEMNHLFLQMHSLLPNPTAKRDKASVVSETINYIQFLQWQLAIHSKKQAATKPPKQTSISTVLPKYESISSLPETGQASSSDCARSDALLTLSTKTVEENLTVKDYGNDIFIAMNSLNKENLLPSIIYVVESHRIQVMDGFVSTADTVAFHCLHGKAAEILDPGARENLQDTLKSLMKSEFQIKFRSNCRSPVN